MPECLKPWPVQIAVCERFGTRPASMLHHDRVGIALSTLQSMPINGLPIPGLSGLSGWYIYGGSTPSEDPDFYHPLCVGHLQSHCPIAVPYLFLPAGWRFQIHDAGYEDVWFDENLLRRD